MTPGRGGAPLRRQLVLTTSGLTAAAMLLVVVLVQLMLHRVIDDNLEEVLRDRVASAQSVFEESDGARAQREQDEMGQGVAVYGPDGSLLTGSLSTEAATHAAALSTTRVERSVEVDERYRLLAVPFDTGQGTGVVIAAESVVPYEQAEAYALTVSIALGLVTVAGVAAVTAWTVRRSLAPVAAMAATADDWSAHDLGRRFELGPPTNEITALGATLDRLLDRVARALRAEQRLTAEVAHELRTPLTALVGAADVALMRRDLDPGSREAFEQIAVSARRMADTVTALVDLARAGDRVLGETCTVGDVVDGLDLDGEAASVSPEQRRLVLGLPAALAVRAVNPVLDNARSHARTSVRVSVRPAESGVDLLVEDDGEGLGDQDGGDIFRPGVRSPGSPGAGLGLPLARRIARAAGGDVLWEPSDVGSRFVVRLPRG